MGFDHEDKNYHIVDELAYTEDNVLVYNVFVYQIPKKTTQAEILEYFSKFGEVNFVRLVADKHKLRRKAPKVGFVHYVDAGSAAKVLQQKSPHVFNSKMIYVRACDSWNQPAITMQNAGEETVDSEIVEKETFQLTMLNDDCLEYIVKKLELKDQVRFSLACQHFKNIFEMVCKTEHRIYHMEQLESLTLWEIREFLLVAGPHVEALIGAVPYKDRDRIIEFIGKFCRNVKHISFDSSNLKWSTLMKLEKLQSCTVLELRDCSLNDSAILALKKLQNLEYLSVAENFELTGKNIARLTTVKDLVLYGCGNIQPSHFIEVIKSLKNLQSLDIQRCERLSADSLEKMLNYCHNLESLKISSQVMRYKCIALLPSLKKLEILSVSTAVTLHTKLFETLAEHKADKLESLKLVARNCIDLERASQIARIINLKQLICANNEGLTDECLHKLKELKNLEEIVLKNCGSITNEGLLQLVKSCTKLKKVNIQLCNRITDQFVLKVIDVLESTQNVREKGPCVFFVAKSGISTYMINHNGYMAAADCGLLKLSFFAPISGFEGEEVFDDYNIDDFDGSIFGEDDDDDDYDDSYDMFDTFSDADDYDDEEINEAYDMFGHYYINYGGGFDINGIW